GPGTNPDPAAKKRGLVNLTYSHGFHPGETFDLSLAVTGTSGGGSAGITFSVSGFKYVWAWLDRTPKVYDTNVTAEEKMHTGGWGETWNFSARVWDPQHDNVSVSAWITSATGETRKVFTTSVQGAGDTRAESNLTYFMYSGFGPNDAQTSWSVTFNVTDYNGHSNNATAPDIQVEKDDVDIQLFNGNNSVV
ncbi:MAG: hypothetical protein SVU32_09600, partial [Candidatus Nanohaloarchaea archaeon]|nr:hypothetical protein [Candidatus Nanohaloarchaea archaeon]